MAQRPIETKGGYSNGLADHQGENNICPWVHFREPFTARIFIFIKNKYYKQSFYLKSR